LDHSRSEMNKSWSAMNHFRKLFHHCGGYAVIAGGYFIIADCYDIIVGSYFIIAGCYDVIVGAKR